MSKQDDLKRATGEAALKFIKPGTVVGVGTGSTVNFFIDALAREMKYDIKGAVSSSEASTKRLKEHGIDVFDLNEVSHIPVYVDGADETNHFLQLIKGGGGALTREKLVAHVSEQFVCIADESKLVHKLGKFPLPIEVLPMARSLVAREMVTLGGRPEWRVGFTTDNGNVILDVHELDILKASEMEREINNIPGVVTNGLFALRPADVLLLGTKNGVQEVLPGQM